MTVREKTWRRRFMIFELESSGEADASLSSETPGMDNDMVFQTIKAQFNRQRMSMRDMRFRLVFFQDPIGVVRFSHLYKDQIMQVVNEVEVDGRKARSVRTSGTLKTLKVWLKEKRGVVMPGKIRHKKKSKSEEKGGQ